MCLKDLFWAHPCFNIQYINGIQHDIDSDYFLFADDTMLLEKVFSPQSAAHSLNKDLNSNSVTVV